MYLVKNQHCADIERLTLNRTLDATRLPAQVFHIWVAKSRARTRTLARQSLFFTFVFHKPKINTNNDPSAGSPTETLLRLLLPLNATVWSSSRQAVRVIRLPNSPRTSLKRSIGSSDGRCVQRAGT